MVGLFRLAGLEEDEDLLYACTMDVRCLYLYLGKILVHAQDPRILGSWDPRIMLS